LRAVPSIILRNQFNSLKGDIDDANANAEARPFKPMGVDDLSWLTISNPPTQAEVVAIRDAFNELLAALKT
jgi:hypothetical protein